jgi:flagellar biosynthesis protein FlhG
LALQANDQAEGLRRMLGRQTPKVITFVSGGRHTGKTTSAINIAVALAQAGRGVMLLDENRGTHNIGGSLGIETQADLLDVMRGMRAFEQAMVAGPQGIVILPAGRGVHALGEIDEYGRSLLIEGFARVAAGLDYIIVDTAPGLSSRLLPLSHPEQETILVAGHTGPAQADAYGMMKLLHRELGKRDLRLLVSLVRTDEEAAGAYRNIAGVARHYLGATVDYLGVVPLDERVRKGFRAGRAAIEMFAHAPCSQHWRTQAQQIMQWPGPKGAGGMDGFVQRLILGSRFRVGAAAHCAA